jgi:hypothetical protein
MEAICALRKCKSPTGKILAGLFVRATFFCRREAGAQPHPCPSPSPFVAHLPPHPDPPPQGGRESLSQMGPLI